MFTINYKYRCMFFLGGRHFSHFPQVALGLVTPFASPDTRQNSIIQDIEASD